MIGQNTYAARAGIPPAELLRQVVQGKAGAALSWETDGAWAGRRLNTVPAAWRRAVGAGHARRAAANPAAGNAWLIGVTDAIGALRVPLDLSDADLVAMAGRLSAAAMGLGEVAPGVYLSEPAALRRRLVVYVERYGIRPPAARRLTAAGKWLGVTDSGAIARMCCPLWWRRKLREAQARALEAKAIELGFVHRWAEKYASDATVARRAQQRARNAKGLENTEAINRDSGEIYRLADLAAASVANPRIRRGELMTRIAGFEAVALGLGDAGEFVTLTAPSAYHPKRTGEGGRVEENAKYNGATPRETQGYLARVWARIRAALARRGVSPYGFRIAEPHHDATPHWHLLLFVAVDALAILRKVFRDYALREDGDEAGAAENRVKSVAIDPRRGSAAGYVAKYVSKNIDGGGYQVQGDIEGGPGGVFPGHRVEAWASTWGIRQFQQVGGPPVGVWRELRRLEVGAGYTAIIEAARSAADCGRSGRDETGSRGNWRRYVEVMGGPVCRRQDRPIGIAKTREGEVYRYAAGELESANLSRYGETAPGKAYGVIDRAAGQVFVSVRYAWEIKPAGAAPESFWPASVGLNLSGFASPWIHVNNCTGAAIPVLSWDECREKTAVSDRDIWLSGAALSAWELKGGDCGRSERDTAGGRLAGRGSDGRFVGDTLAP